MLHKFVICAADNWDTLLPSVLFAYRTVISDVTIAALCQILYGCQLRFAIDMLTTSMHEIEKEISDFVDELCENLCLIKTETHLWTTESQQKSKARFNKKVKLRNYQLGDIVLLRSEGEQKACKRWIKAYSDTVIASLS